MKSGKDLNDSNGVTLYAYAVNNVQVTNFMKLADLQKEPKPSGAVIITAFINGGKF
jgi:hypothetical protein